MHKSLTVRANILLALLWAGLFVLAVAAKGPPAPGPVMTAALLGLFSGWLQGRAVAANAGRLGGAKSAMDVRRIMISTFPGKLSILLLWATGSAAFLWALVIDAENLLELWVPVYAAFALVREVVVLPALAHLKRMLHGAQ